LSIWRNLRTNATPPGAPQRGAVPHDPAAAQPGRACPKLIANSGTDSAMASGVYDGEQRPLSPGAIHHSSSRSRRRSTCCLDQQWRVWREQPVRDSRARNRMLVSAVRSHDSSSALRASRRHDLWRRWERERTRLPTNAGYRLAKASATMLPHELPTKAASRLTRSARKKGFQRVGRSRRCPRYALTSANWFRSPAAFQAIT